MYVKFLFFNQNFDKDGRRSEQRGGIFFFLMNIKFYIIERKITTNLVHNQI